MDNKHSKHINPLRASDSDERQSLSGGLFASEDEGVRQDQEKMRQAHAGYGQKMDGKIPSEPAQNHGGLDPDDEMEEKG